MTSNEIIEANEVVGEKNVEVLNDAFFASPERIYSKPFDITAKDNAKIEADKVESEAKRVEMENIENKKKMPMPLFCEIGVKIYE